MKTFIVSLALALSAPAFALDSKSFEVESKGCFYSATRATCVFANNFQFDTLCDVSISVTTNKGLRIINAKRVTIQAKTFKTIEAASAEEDPIKLVNASGVCRVKDI